MLAERSILVIKITMDVFIVYLLTRYIENQQDYSVSNNATLLELNELKHIFSF